jgi:hypothetical protein
MRRDRKTLQWAICLLWLASDVASSPASQLDPRKASEYPHACQFKGGRVVVDYLRRSLPTPLGTIFIPGMLIFEVAAHPNSGSTLEFPLKNFQLDWKKLDWPLQPLHSQQVVASLMDPEYNRLNGRFGAAGIGRTNPRNGELEGVSVGGPTQRSRFPGDPRGDRPLPETIPADTRLKKAPSHADSQPPRIIVLHALGAEPVGHPSAGYVYFAYNGKLVKLRELTLTIRQGQESCDLLIRK